MSDETPTPKKKFEPIKISDEKLAELDVEHDDVLKLEGSEESPWLVVLRRPTRQETIGYKHEAKKDSLTASEALIKKICVYPPREDVERQIARWPFFPDGIADSKAFKNFVGISVDAGLK